MATRVLGALDFPFKSHYVELDGRKIHFVDEGEGPPILLVHGNPSWSFLYRKVIPPLVADGYRCVAPDLLGFGLSDKPLDEEAYSFPMHVDLITQLVKKLELRGVVTVGHDWGGPISLRYAIDHRENVRGVIILNTFVRSRRLPFWYSMFFRSGAVASFLVRRLDLFRQVAFRFGFARPPGREIIRQYEMPHPTAASRAGIAAFPKMVPNGPEHENARAIDEIDHVLSRWQIPTLVLWSSKDRLLRLQEGIRIADRIPLSNFHLIRNAGHFLQEDAGEEIAGDIIVFLQDRVEKSTSTSVQGLLHGILQSSRQNSSQSRGPRRSKTAASPR